MARKKRGEKPFAELEGTWKLEAVPRKRQVVLSGPIPPLRKKLRKKPK